MVKKSDLDLDLPPLPALPAKPQHKVQSISESQFTRRKLQALLHIITGELKARGTKTPHIFLPFRSRVDDTKLNLFLRRVFPGGVMVDTSNKAILRSILHDFDEFTLICGLKYLWCRLPNNEIIGWPVYLEFKRKEHDAGYPKDAFLTIMPKCLSSSSHASIVYDFLDLLISVASNSQYNHLNGRKISKMASIWAFKSTPESTSAFYDATLSKESSFLDGLEAWKKTCNGLFHLLLAFLRAMLPDKEADTLNLPKTLQSLLVTNTYPPPENTSSMKSVITIPCVHVRSTRKSGDPYELISKVRHSLSFEKKDSFLSIENFTILKHIFQKPSTAEIVSTLSDESRRVLARLTADPIPSNFDLYPGWARSSSSSEDSDIPLYSEVTITSVTLQDYSIWTWLSSLGSDQASCVKSLFGRSIVVEAGLRGFQKWMVLTETNISSEEYLSIFKSTKHDIGAGNFSHSDNISPMPREIKTSQGSRGTTTSKEGNRPPPPPPSKTDRLPPTPQESPLPDVTFSNDHFSFEDGEFASYQYKDEPSSSSGTSNGLSQKFKEKMVISSKKALNRPRPPPLESPPKQSSPSNEPQVKRAPPSVPDWQSQNQIPFDPNEHEYQNDSANLHPEGSQKQYQEPFERYNTPFDREQQNASLEPFDNYPIPEEHKAGGEKQLLNQQRNNPEIYRDDFHQPHNADDEQSNEIGRQVPPIHTSKDSNSNQSNMSPKFPLQKHNVSSKNSDRMIYDHNQRNVSGYAQPHTQVHHDPHSLKDEVIRPQDQERQTHVSYLEENMTESSLGSKGNFKSDIQKEGDSDKFEMKKKKPGNDLENTLDNVPDGHPPPFIGSGSDDESSTPRYNTTHSEHENRGQPAMTSNETVQGNGKFQSSSQSNYPTPISQDYVDPKTGPFPEGERKQDSDSDKLRSTPRLPIISQSHEYSTEPPSQKAVYPESSFANSPVIRVNPDSNQAFYSQNSVSSSGQPYMEPSYHYSNAPGVNSDVYPEVTSKHGYQVYNSEENIERINNVPQRQIPGSHYVESQPAASRNPSSTNHHGHVHLPYQQSYQSGPTTDQQEPSQEVGNWQRQTQNGARVVSAGQFQLGKMQQMHHGQGLSGQEHSRAPSKAHSLPGHAMPLPYKPNQMMPVQPLPGQHIQGTHMAGQPMSGQPMPVNLGQSFNGQPAPQYYYPTPPQGYYTATPQGYGYPQPPQMYYPPPGGFYPPQPYHQATPPAKTKPSTSELTMMSMPSANAFKKNSKPNKANLRAALNQGTFGI